VNSRLSPTGTALGRDRTPYDQHDGYDARHQGGHEVTTGKEPGLGVKRERMGRQNGGTLQARGGREEGSAMHMRREQFIEGCTARNRGAR
jgi:hypothetical protein